MHYSRVAAFILGAWIAGSLFMAFAASQNFRRADDAWTAPPPQAANMIERLGRENSRLLLRHLAGEENRFYFNGWEDVQFGLGILLTGILYLAAKNRVLAICSAAMLVLVAFAHFILTPELIWLGRSIEFLPPGAPSPQRDQFWKLHAMYGVMEAAKLLLGIVIASVLFTVRRRVRYSDKLDLLDTAPSRESRAI